MSAKSQSKLQHSASPARPEEEQELQLELKRLRKEITKLDAEAKLAPRSQRSQIKDESHQLKRTVSDVLLSLGEQVPFVGPFIKWLRS